MHDLIKIYIGSTIIVIFTIRKNFRKFPPSTKFPENLQPYVYIALHGNQDTHPRATGRHLPYGITSLRQKIPTTKPPRLNFVWHLTFLRAR